MAATSHPTTEFLLSDLLTSCPREQRLPQLRTAVARHTRALQVLEQQRLRYEETGWLADWQAQHARHTKIVADLNQAIAEEFGA